ncbi:DUF3800 domain-containing protein [Luteococcus peritonei]|uniref:DUF3800 domain-containing protein n=1 Tax=Luteococcus peritonei TaxID=88874 RepID=A0ABW4S0J7_9ACTN
MDAPVDARPTRLFYVDDSGAERSGIATYSWIELTLEQWRPALCQVLDWRDALDEAHAIPKQRELHAVEFANGRGNPSLLGDEWNRCKPLRQQVMDETFACFAGWSWLRGGTVYSRSRLTRDAFARERGRVYRELVSLLDARLEAAGEWGILVMDGDGSDQSYVQAHRGLPVRRRALIEDPCFQQSARSQWVQVADLVAYAGYQHLARLPHKRFAWDWYPSLAPAMAAPVEV